MISNLQAPRGTFDVLPEQEPARTAVERAARRILEGAGYRRIETPAFDPVKARAEPTERVMELGEVHLF